MTAEQEIHVYSDSGTLTTGTHKDDTFCIRNKNQGLGLLAFMITFSNFSGYILITVVPFLYNTPSAVKKKWLDERDGLSLEWGQFSSILLSLCT